MGNEKCLWTPKGITMGLKANFETWRAVFKRFFFLSESLSKVKCFGIFLEKLYPFKGKIVEICPYSFAF